MNWLITGGCGFLGTSLIHRLLSEGGHRIRVIDNFSVGTRQDLALVCNFVEISPEQAENGFISDKIQLIEGDITDSSIAVKITTGANIVIHFAANTGVGPSVDDPRGDMQSNVVGTFNYLEASRINQCSRFVFASSGAPAGEVEPPIHEELPSHPVSPYGASKLAGEGYCSAYKRSFGLDTVALRFGNVYGPGSLHKSSVVAKFIQQAINKETLEIYGNGSQTRDFIYIDDLIDAVILAAFVPNIGGEVFQIATSRETSVVKMTEMLIGELKAKGYEGIKLINTMKRTGDVMRNYSDTSKARMKLGWQAKVKLNVGLKKTIEYFLS